MGKNAQSVALIVLKTILEIFENAKKNPPCGGFSLS